MPTPLSFNANWYLQQNPDVAAAIEAGAPFNAMEHFTLYGRAEGRSASTLFDPQNYLASNTDVAEAVAQGLITAWDHFELFGGDEGRIPTPLFNEAFYLQQNPDVATAIQQGVMSSAAQHFVLFGQNESRPINPAFDLGKYINANPDVAQAVENGLINIFNHLMEYGVNEGRDLGNGVSLSEFGNDPGFSQALTNGNVVQALTRVESVAPFLPTFEHPAGWTPPVNTPIPVDFLPPVDSGIKLIVPPEVVVPNSVVLPENVFEVPTPEPTPADPGPVTPAFSVTASNGAISFSGDASGDITVVLNDDLTWSFKKGTTADSNAIKVDPTTITSITVASGNTLAGTAEHLAGKSIAGAGNVVITAIEADSNLSTIIVTGTKTTQITHDLILDTADLGGFSISVDADKTLTGTAAQLAGTTAILSPSTPAVPGKLISGAGNVTVTGLKSTSDLLKITVSGIKITQVTESVTINKSTRLSDFSIEVATGYTVSGHHTALEGKRISGPGNVTVTSVPDTDGSAFALIDNTVTTLTLEARSFSSGTTISVANLAKKGVVIKGNYSNDTLTGGTGNDAISGGNGNDTITGGAGADTLTGDAGSDTFVMGTIADFALGEVMDGGDGDDTLQFNEAGAITYVGRTITSMQILDLTAGAANALVVTQGTGLSTVMDLGAAGATFTLSSGATAFDSHPQTEQDTVDSFGEWHYAAASANGVLTYFDETAGEAIAIALVGIQANGLSGSVTNENGNLLLSVSALA